jgi:hypothetical protein
MEPAGGGGAGMAQPIIPPTWVRLVGLIDQLEEMEEHGKRPGKKGDMFLHNC